MSDLPIELLDGAAIALAGVVVGRFLPARRKGPEPKADPRPICGCAHHLSFHDPKTGVCHGVVDGEVTGRNSWGYPDAWAQVQCSCRKYTGPEPLPELYAGEITS